jgi:hypothetical protein
MTALCNDFLQAKLIEWPLAAEAKLKSHSVFNGKADLWDMLRKRVVQHNIRVASLYYNKITLKRLEQLANLGAKVGRRYY